MMYQGPDPDTPARILQADQLPVDDGIQTNSVTSFTLVI